MGIPTLINKIKNKIEKKKAIETGKKLSDLGVTKDTPKTTTGNYVTPKGEVSVSEKGDVSIVKKNTSTNVGSSNNKIINTQTQNIQQNTEQTNLPSAEIINRTPKSIKINRSGSVTIGNREYVGNSYIPELNKTANEVHNETRMQINKERSIGSSAVGQGRYSAKGEIIEPEYSQREIQASRQIGRNENALSNISLDFPNLNFSSEETLPKWGMTKLDYGTQDKNTQIYLPGTIYSYKTGEYKEVPIYTTRVVQETGESRLASLEESKIIFQSEVRPATVQEIKGLTTFGKVKGKIATFSGKDWNPGVYTEKKIISWSTNGGKGKQFISGMAIGIIPTNKGEIIKDVGTFAIGGAVGGSIKGIGIGLSKVPKAGKYLSPAFKIGSYGAGSYFTGAYAIEKANQIYSTKGYSSKGEVFGSSIKEFGLLSSGYAVGSKSSEKIYGFIRTRGRTEITLDRLTRKEVILGKESFPTSPKGTHLNLFKETTNRLPELTNGKPGGFHVTPEKFWNSKAGITPKAGTSELPGLYVSSEASIHFSGIANNKGYSLFNLPKIKNFTKGDNAAIAFLKPLGFREVGFRKVNPYIIDNQKFRYNFKNKAKKGFIDIPNMKTEIEGIARVNAGSYNIKSSNYYTTIKGVRVPLDVFESDIINKVKVKDIGKRTKRKFSSKDYGSYPEKSSLINTGSLFYPSLYSSRLPYSKVSYRKSSSKLSSYTNVSRYSKSSVSNNRLKSYTYSNSNTGKSYFSKNRTSSILPYSTSKRFIFKNNYNSKVDTQQSLIPVFGRRFGKFNIIGYGKNEAQALDIGKNFAKKTLGATFKIPGAKTTQLAGYKTKYSNKEGKVFIQLPKYRLSSGTEKAEIQMFNRLKGGKR